MRAAEPRRWSFSGVPKITKVEPTDLTLTSCQATKQASLGDAVLLTRRNIGCVAAATVVVYHQHQGVTLLLQRHAAQGGLGVPHHVGHRFSQHHGQGRFFAGLQRADLDVAIQCDAPGLAHPASAGHLSRPADPAKPLHRLPHLP